MPASSQMSPTTNQNTVTYPVQGVDLGNQSFSCTDYGFDCQNTSAKITSPCCLKCYDANYSKVLSDERSTTVKVFRPIIWKMFYPNCSVGNSLCNPLGGAYVSAVTVCNQQLW